MHRTLIAGMALFCASSFCSAESPATAPASTSAEDGICLFTGAPPADHTYLAVKELK